MKLGPDFFNDNTQQIMDCLDGPDQECCPMTPAETTRGTESPRSSYTDKELEDMRRDIELAKRFQKAAEMYNTALRTYDGKSEDPRPKDDEDHPNTCMSL